MEKKASPNAGGNRETPSDAPFTTFFQLNKRSIVPTEYRTAPAFSITRLRSPFGLQDRITKSSSVPALLLSVSLKALPAPSYRVWTGDKLIKTSTVHSFRSNVVDFDFQPRCWAGSAFDFIHYSIPRSGLDDIAEDLGYGRVREYRPAVLEDDLVVTQITKNILPHIGRNDALSVLALDQFGLILGAHLLQGYGVLATPSHPQKGGLAPWQRRRALELLRENLNGHIRLGVIAGECGLSVSHFARSFKISVGVSAHQWLIQSRIGFAKELMIKTGRSLTDISVQCGFSDQAAFTNAFRQSVGVSPGRWRRDFVSRGSNIDRRTFSKTGPVDS